MFRLPKCPYCGTKYYYSDVKKEKKKKENICPHCMKKFKITFFPQIIVLMLIISIPAVLTNIFALNLMKNFSIITLIVISFCYVIAGIILLPFFIKFKAALHN